MTSKKQTTKLAAPEPKGFSWGETQTGISPGKCLDQVAAGRGVGTGEVMIRTLTDLLKPKPEAAKVPGRQEWPNLHYDRTPVVTHTTKPKPSRGSS